MLGGENKLKIIDISNRHKKKYVAFIEIEKLHIIVACNTLVSLARWIKANNFMGEMAVFDSEGREIEFNPLHAPYYNIHYKLTGSVLMLLAILSLVV